MDYRRISADRMAYKTIYLVVVFAFSAINATEHVSTALAVVEGSTLPTPIAIAADLSDSFLELMVFGNIFIDKTMMLKELFQPQETFEKTKWTFLIRPDGWGKSVNLNMMKIFFGIRVNATTRTIIPNNESAPYRLFEHGEILIKDGTETRKLRNRLLIAEDREFMRQHQGQYMVVHMHMGRFNATSLKELRKEVSLRAGMAFEPYDFAYVAEELGVDRHLSIEMVLRIEFGKPDGENDWRPFDCLCYMMKKYYKREIILLIEDYDEPMLRLLASSVENKTIIAEQFSTFYRYFFEMLQENKYCRKIIVTGTTRMVFNDRLPFNPGPVQNDLQNELAGESIYAYQGFNEREMDMIFDHLNMSASLREPARDHYSGYQFYRNERNKYNPSSVAKFLSKRKTDDYWKPKPLVKATFAKALTIPTFRYMLPSLSAKTKCPYYDPIALQKESLDSVTLDTFFRFLENGRNTRTQSEIDANTALGIAHYLSRGLGYLTYSHSIPNKEVRSVIRGELLSFYSCQFKYKGEVGPANSSLHALCEKFHEFILSKDNQSKELDGVFLNFLNDLDGFKSSIDALVVNESGQGLQEVSVVRDVLNFIATYMNDFHVGYSGAGLSSEQGVVDGSITLNQPNRFIVIHMIVRYVPGKISDAAQKFSEYLSTFNDEPFSKVRVRRIGIYYDAQGKYMDVLAV